MVNQRILGIRNIPAEIPRLQSSGVIDCEPRFPVRSDKKTGSRESTRASGGKGVLPMSGGVRRLSWRFVLSLPITSRSARARDMTARPVLETLEGRQLLAVFTGFTHVRNVSTATGVYSLQIIGPGVLKPQPAGGGSFNLKVLGTTADSTLTITQVRPRFHLPNGLMSIDTLTIGSGQIGAILAGSVELDGTMSPINSAVGTLEFGALGPAGRFMSTAVSAQWSLGPSTLAPAAKS